MQRWASCDRRVISRAAIKQWPRAAAAILHTRSLWQRHAHVAERWGETKEGPSGGGCRRQALSCPTPVSKSQWRQVRETVTVRITPSENKKMIVLLTFSAKVKRKSRTVEKRETSVYQAVSKCFKHTSQGNSEKWTNFSPVTTSPSYI